MEVTTYEQAEALANQIRSGALQGAEKDQAMDALRVWHKGEREEVENPKKKENFFARMNTNIEKRQQMLTDTMEATATGEQTYAEGVLQVAGKYGAGLVMDFMGEALVSGGRGLSAITPDMIEDPLVNTATEAGYALLNTDVGQAGIAAALEGVEKYQEWAQANPRAARNVEAVTNVAMLAAPVKSKPKASLSNGSRTADRIRISADRTEFRRREDFVADLVSPPTTKLVKEDQVLRTVPRQLFGVQIGARTVPTTGELSAATAVAGLPVKASNSLTANARIIKEAIVDESKILQAQLKSKDSAYRLDDLAKVLDDAKQRLSHNLVVKGDAEKAAVGLIDDTMNLIRQKPTTTIQGSQRGLLSDVFRVRQELDQAFIKAGRPPSRWAELGTTESGQSVALRELRTTLNRFVADHARTPGVENSLRRQAALYRGLDNVIPKAASEASSIFGQVWGRMLKLLPLRGEINQLGALAFGVGGLGAGAILGPAMTKMLMGGIAGYGTYRALTSPAARRGLAMMVDQINKAAKLPGLTAGQIHQLRADRAFIVDLLKDTDDLLPHWATPEEAKAVENDDDAQKVGQQQ